MSVQLENVDTHFTIQRKGVCIHRSLSYTEKRCATDRSYHYLGKWSISDGIYKVCLSLPYMREADRYPQISSALLGIYYHLTFSEIFYVQNA